MPDLYITADQLTDEAIAHEADGTSTWELLAESVSRLFDRECEVTDGFFSVADSEVSLRSYYADGTKYLKLSPYIPGSITIIDVDGTDYFEAVAADREYREKDGYLIFDMAMTVDVPVDVTARYGFATIAADIKQACIEQALFMYRKKDLAFTDLSGVSAAAVNAEFSPTFIAITKRYREIYSSNSYFS